VFVSLLATTWRITFPSAAPTGRPNEAAAVTAHPRQSVIALGSNETRMKASCVATAIPIAQASSSPNLNL
jgi:hypothetical protein